MNGIDPNTGQQRAPFPGESLMGGPPETSPRKPQPPQRTKPKGLFHQFTEEERDNLLREVGRAWSGPMPEEEQEPLSEEEQRDQIAQDEMRSLIREALLREGGFSTGLHRNAIQMDAVSKQYGWDKQQDLDAMMALEALAEDGDLMYEDMAFAAYIDEEDRPLAIVFDVNAAGAFDENEFGFYYPETGETEYFTSEEFDEYMGYDDQPSQPTDPDDLGQLYDYDAMQELEEKVLNMPEIKRLGE